MANGKNTKAVDGYRWLSYQYNRSIEDHTTVYHLVAQKRATTDSGAVYFIYGKRAEFDTAEVRAEFMKCFSAKEWY